MRANEEVLFESSSQQVSAPAYRAAIRDVLTRIEAIAVRRLVPADAGTHLPRCGPTLRKNVSVNGASPCGTPTMPMADPGRAMAAAVAMDCPMPISGPTRALQRAAG